MSSYDDRLYAAKRAVTETICMVVSTDEKKHERGLENLPGDVDELNKAWDELTNCLIRQRTERDEVIYSLINQLAEAKKEG